MNSKELDRRLRELTAAKKKKSSFYDTSDHTRNIAGSIQNGLYLGQLALGLFRNITNYHLPPKKRIKQVILTISILVVANYLRKKIMRRNQ